MLKNERGKPREKVTVTEAVFNEMKKEIKDSIPKLLNAAEILLSNAGDPTIVAGLYTYAVEEYGKHLVLKECVPSDGKVEIPYRDKFRNHTEKFKKALDCLPTECKLLHSGSFASENFSSEDFDVDEIADMDARLAAFYKDFRESANGIKRPPTVDANNLKKAIAAMRPFVASL